MWWILTWETIVPKKEWVSKKVDRNYWRFRNVNHVCTYFFLTGLGGGSPYYARGFGFTTLWWHLFTWRFIIMDEPIQIRDEILLQPPQHHHAHKTPTSSRVFPQPIKHRSSFEEHHYRRRYGWSCNREANCIWPVYRVEHGIAVSCRAGEMHGYSVTGSGQRWDMAREYCMYQVCQRLVARTFHATYLVQFNPSGTVTNSVPNTPLSATTQFDGTFGNKYVMLRSLTIDVCIPHPYRHCSIRLLCSRKDSLRAHWNQRNELLYRWQSHTRLQPKPATGFIGVRIQCSRFFPHRPELWHTWD